MIEARRKCLDLLEYCLELAPDTPSVYDLLLEAHPSGNSAYGIGREQTTDYQWVVLLEQYADKLTKEERKRHNV